MLKFKFILATALLLFGSSVSAGIIANAEALIARSTVNSIPKVPVPAAADMTEIPGTEIDITSLIDSIAEDLNKVVGAIPVAQTTGSTITVNQVSLPDIDILASIEPEILKVSDDEAGLLATNTLAEELPVPASDVSQPVPAPPVLWLFGIGLIGLLGFRRQRESA